MQIRLPGAVFTVLYAVEETTGPSEPWREVARYETRDLANRAVDSLPATGSYRIVPVAPNGAA
jgi:hypothetical protein